MPGTIARNPPVDNSSDSNVPYINEPVTTMLRRDTPDYAVALGDGMRKFDKSMRPRTSARVFSSVAGTATWVRPAVLTVQCLTTTVAGRQEMTVTQDDIIWTDPSDGYTIRVVRYPYSVEPEGGGLLMGFSFHTGVLWTEIPGRDNPDERPTEIHIGPLVKTHARFPAALHERGFGPDTHYLLGRRQGGLPLRLGSRPAVDALLAELKSQWREYRRASDPEYRIQGLRAIRRLLQQQFSFWRLGLSGRDFEECVGR